MKAKDKILFIFFFICAWGVKAQVKLQNGTPDFSIPIFSFSDDVNRISTSISLNYSGGNGIKVNDIASDVGLGWELTSPGVIVRNKNGEPDDQRKMNSLLHIPWKGYLESGFWIPPPSTTEVVNLEELNKYIFGNGYLFNTINPEIPVNPNVAYVPSYPASQFPINYQVGFKPPLELLHDTEQDIFNFEFNGRKGSFVFSKDGQIRTLEDSRLKVTPTFLDMSASNIRTQIKSFTITDEFGIKYVFNDNSLEELCTYKRTRMVLYDENGDIRQGQTYPAPTVPLPHIDTYDATPINQYVISKWYLSSIVNPMTSKQINFEYDSYALDYIASKDLTSLSKTSTIYYDRTISITNVRAKSTEKRVKKINLPNGAFVQYDYNLDERVDLMGSNTLKKISINEGGHQISHELEYGYFVKKEIKNENATLSALEKKYARLCLKSITKKGENNDNGGVYLFDYFTGFGSTYFNDNIPPRLSLPTDVFGYYNSIYQYDPTELDPNYNYPNFNILANCFNFSSFSRERQHGSPLYRNGLIKTITNPYKGTTEFEYEPNLKFDDSQINNNTYYGGARVAKIIQFDGLSHSNDIITEYKYTKPDGSCSIWGNDPSLINYYYTYARQYKTTQPHRAGIQAKEILLASIKFTSAFTNANRDIRSSKVDVAGKAVSSFVYGAVMSVFMNFLNYVFSPIYIENQYYKSSYYPLSFKNPLPLQFSRVEVVNKSTSLNSGKTVFEFTTDQDYPIDVPVYNFPFSSEHRSFNSAYGLSKKTTFFNSTNAKVKQVENFYDYKKYVINQANYASQNWEPLTIFSSEYHPGIIYINSIPNEAITRKIYYPIVGRVELTKSIETIYNNNNDELISSTDYFYHPNNFLLSRKETTDSKNKVIKSSNFFPEDYTLSSIPVLQGLVNNNIVNLPISTEIWQTKQGGAPEMLSSSVTEYGLAPNGDYKPIKMYSLETDKPIAQNVIGVFDPNQLVRSVSIKPKTEIAYNGDGTAFAVKDLEGLRNTTTLYSYNNMYPIASVNNAVVDEIAYTSFEAFEQAYIYNSNWDINNVDILTEVAPTGRKSCSLKVSPFQSVVRATIAMNQDYKLSLWATSSSFTVNNVFSPSVTGTTINGWTYYEFNIAQGSLSPIIRGNNCRIDELRLYPKKATLNTTAYDPGVGKTSECDINNNITYYEYDGLGRIIKVLDERHNIIKTYEYHFKN